MLLLSSSIHLFSPSIPIPAASADVAPSALREVSGRSSFSKSLKLSSRQALNKGGCRPASPDIRGREVSYGAGNLRAGNPRGFVVLRAWNLWQVIRGHELPTAL